MASKLSKEDRKRRARERNQQHRQEAREIWREAGLIAERDTVC